MCVVLFLDHGDNEVNYGVPYLKLVLVFLSINLVTVDSRNRQVLQHQFKVIPL